MRQALAGIILAAGLTASCGGGGEGTVRQPQFEALYRAGKALTAATATGVTQFQFGPLRQALATEVAIAKDRAQSGAERGMVETYDQALDIYSDAATVWSAGHGPVFVSSHPEVKRIVDTYAFDGQGVGDDFHFNAETAVGVIFRQASAKVAQAESIYLGTPLAGSPVPGSDLPLIHNPR